MEVSGQVNPRCQMDRRLDGPENRSGPGHFNSKVIIFGPIRNGVHLSQTPRQALQNLSCVRALVELTLCLNLHQYRRFESCDQGRTHPLPFQEQTTQNGTPTPKLITPTKLWRENATKLNFPLLRHGRVLPTNPGSHPVGDTWGCFWLVENYFWR